MSEAFELVQGDSDILIVVDHASNHVPPDIDLGIGPDLLHRHIGWDIGAASLGQALCERLGAPGIFGAVSRLVIDLHREEHSPALIPETSDGHVIPGNQGLSGDARQDRVERFWRLYHQALAGQIERLPPALIAAVHSFTPRLETSAGSSRPWEIGILYNQDDRAARLAIAELRRQGFVTGDNEPYSGKLLNATMNMHAEANGIPYLAIEIRNDLIGEPQGAARWAHILESLLLHCRNKLAQTLVPRP
ncbi:N-formylglutamate amidohydrolase [Sphingomonas sp. ID1715]|uniref:N-formylglutamate amidohydrolase n=1 Tax=Sphingomonas sp. ID1715 TaxID=1656898 RepID=UPI0014894EA1|nr:N-formylglutamate amidohydrolase [Sphingomonas sp. ID1715]NNM76260.1 N-formylglutamate amidohydrolase [Sphingomonas sp. ID1715]